MKKVRKIVPIILVLAILAVIYWYVTTRNKQVEDGSLSGSGTVEATEVTISPEVSGRITDVLVSDGDKVNLGDTLLVLDGSLMGAQLNQAQENLNAARAGMEVAQNSYRATLAGQETAQAQYNLTLAQALQLTQPTRINTWGQDSPTRFDQPGWYYTHPEQLTAALQELNSTQIALDEAQANLDSLMSTGNYKNLSEIETRLARARVAYLDAQDVLDRSQLQTDQSLIDSAQQAFDLARDELDAAQSAYDELLTNQETKDIVDARASRAIAQERYDTAQDGYNALLTGKDSLQVQLAASMLAQAQDNVVLAESKVSQAQAVIDQAQAAYDLIDLQMEKLTISAPMSGVILARNIEPGEVVQPGASALTLGDLENLTITVYIPENRYGEVRLGDKALVSVDSFPNQSFSATVTRIADQAEFTPRNVQTVEGRSSTVYAIHLSVEDPQGLLKPGMPSDVTFFQP